MQGANCGKSRRIVARCGFCGNLVGDLLHGPAKATAIQALAAAEGLDLARCSAYSDSVNDLALLEQATDPVATNPSPELEAIARARGWRVLNLFA